jgi:uncharacterized protein (TIRG00374 family)
MNRLVTFGRRWGRLILGTMIGLGIVVWLAATLDFQNVVLALRGVDTIWVGLSLLTVLLTLWARVRRWQMLLESERVTTGGTLQALVLGQLLNLIFPARLGDLGRAYLITQAGYPSQAQALGTVALEKLWDIAMLIGVIIVLSFWYPLPAWVTIPARLTTVVGGLLLLGMATLLFFRHHPATRRFGRQRWSDLAHWHWLARLTGRLIDGLESLRRPRVMLAAGSWSFIAWFFGMLTNLTLLKAFGLPFSLLIAALLLAVLQMGVSVPSLPGRIGVFEGLCLVTLALFGIEANRALAYGLLLHALVLLPPVILGLWWILRLDVATRQGVWELT